MIKIHNKPDKIALKRILSRGTTGEDAMVKERVTSILQEIKESGDKALYSLTKRIEGIDLSEIGFAITKKEIKEAERNVSQELKEAIKNAYSNIHTFHTAQYRQEVRVETQEGVLCWQKAVPINRVGLYIPGGTAPLFSTVLMLAIPAKIANCKEITLCTPPNKEGGIAPEILYTASVCGVDKIYKLGGAVAVGAMAYGTESIPKADKIFGPGNAYVTTAKQMVSLYETAIDMPAGPSEVMVIADETAYPEFVAADMLSQVEHGADSQAILVTTSISIAEQVSSEIDKQAKKLSRGTIIEQSLEKSCILVVDDMSQALSIVNEYAPEHLIIETKDAESFAEEVECAGSIFIGHFSPESAGDYASGTNHTLPTDGWAKAYSGVNLDSFMKKITFQQLTQKGLQKIGSTIEIMAEAEGLSAHKNAVTVRLNKKNK